MVAMVAFVLSGASKVEDDSIRAQPRGLLVFLGSAIIALPTDRQMRTTGSRSPFFLDIDQL